MTANRRAVSICIFVHNEAATIGHCLDALAACGLGPDDAVHLMVNGSTDGSEAIIRGRVADDPRYHIHVLDLADKANAWNHYVHRIAVKGAHHVFLDGDVQPSSNALTAFAALFAANSRALAAAALPQGGRRSRSWARAILADAGMPGNLYALRDTTIARLREMQTLLPVGLVGDDTLLRWLLLRDLDPTQLPDRARIVAAPDVLFSYTSFPILSLAGLAAHYRRQRRYSRRDLEMGILTQELARNGLASLPRHVNQLYRHAQFGSALSGSRQLRQIFFLASYLHARRHQGQSS